MRKHKGAKVSLFAFQDIITATTGILILITLILTFFLNADAQVGESDDLTDKLAKLEAKITQTQSEISNLNRLLKEWGDVDPQKLAEEIKNLQAKLAQLKVEIDDLGEEQKEALELAARLTIEQEKAKKLRMQIESISQMIADLKRKIKEAAAANILFPNISRELANKKLMLVVMAKEKHEIIEYGGGRPLKKTVNSLFALATYLKGKPEPITYQVVFLIKPSGIDDFFNLHFKKDARGEPSELKLMGYKYIGWDALEEDAKLSLE